jgi:amidase
MMKVSEYAKYDGIGLAELVKARQVSPRELAETALEAIDALNDKLNAVVAKTPEETERALREGPGKGPFEGVPFLIKDVGSHFANVPMEFGSRLFEGMVFPYDNELATRFKKSGVVAVGRSNIPEFGASVSTESVKYGPCRNPWNTAHTPGGSSGGAAAAVAAGMVPVAHANDGGGSIRAPASCCGVFGLKPSRFRMPWGPDQDEGIFGLGSELIVSRTVRDSAAMLDATAGADVGARYLLPEPPISYLTASQRDPKRLKIAFSFTPPEGAPEVHAECKQAVLDAAKLCEELGHEVFEATPDVTHDEACAVFRDMAAPMMAGAVQKVCAATGRQVGPDNFEATTRELLKHGANGCLQQRQYGEPEAGPFLHQVRCVADTGVIFAAVEARRAQCQRRRGQRPSVDPQADGLRALLRHVQRLGPAGHVGAAPLDQRRAAGGRAFCRPVRR